MTIAKKSILLLGAASCLALSACNTDQTRQFSDQAETQDFAQAEISPVARKVSAPRAASTAEPAADNPGSLSYLAYRYTYGFSLPVKAVAATAQSHMQICMDAGPDICQVLGSNTNAQSINYVTANLRLRAQPVWLEQFKDTLTTSVKAADGETLNAGVTAEDLTRQIVDTDARLKAQTLLRSRLENLLETRNAKLPDLLSLERELARVQQQIESATTTLNVLKKRVSMSEVTINYQTKRITKPRKRKSPIAGALGDFGNTFAGALSGVIIFIAAILPWMILIIPGVWLIRRWWRKRPARTAKLLPAKDSKV